MRPGIQCIICMACLFLSVTYVPAAAQDRILLQKADQVLGRVIDGRNVTLVIGSVHYYVPERKMNIYCDTTFIFRATEEYVLSGNVLLVEEEKILRSDRINYNAVTEEAFSPGPFSYREPQSDKLLTADTGAYNYKTRVLTAKNNVVYRETFKELYADTLIYDENDKNVEAEGNITYYDFERNIITTSQSGKYDQNNDYAVLTGDPLIAQPDIIGKDTLFISGKTMEYFGGEDSQFIVTDSVKIKRGTLEATSRQATYDLNNAMIYLRDNPAILFEMTEIYGDKIDIKLENDVIKEIIVIDDAVAYTVADTSGRYDFKNELRGKTLNIYLDSEAIEKIVATHNAESVYYSLEKNELQGKNVSTSGKIVILFEHGQLYEIKGINGIMGEYIPAEMLTEENKKNFYE
jgi:lipopolysaccharide export system protein LptA